MRKSCGGCSLHALVDVDAGGGSGGGGVAASTAAMPVSTEASASDGAAADDAAGGGVAAGRGVDGGARGRGRARGQGVPARGRGTREVASRRTIYSGARGCARSRRPGSTATTFGSPDDPLASRPFGARGTAIPGAAAWSGACSSDRTMMSAHPRRCWTRSRSRRSGTAVPAPELVDPQASSQATEWFDRRAFPGFLNLGAAGSSWRSYEGPPGRPSPSIAGGAPAAGRTTSDPFTRAPRRR